MKIPKPLRLSLLLAFGMVTLSACAEYSHKGETPNQENNYLPFSIRFNPQGDIVVLDEKGNRAESQRPQFPIKATQIEQIQSLSYVQYRGSHKGIIIVNGKMYVFTLPH